MRLILDTNVLVSAALSQRSPCADLLNALRDGAIEVVASPALIAELRTVVARPRFQRQLRTDVDVYVEEFRKLCQVAPDPGGVPRVTRDAKDDYLVALALSESVDALVSGDKDLLTMDPAVVRVLTPREAVDEMGR